MADVDDEGSHHEDEDDDSRGRGRRHDGGLLLVTSGAAFADHTHAKVVGNRQCVVLAEGAGEEAVVLPLSVFERNPNVDIAPTATRMHPLHVLVHLGEAGEHNALFVYGTPAEAAACAAGYVNR